MVVQTISVDDDESGLRLDRWFRRHFPTLPHGRLEKLLRSGQVRVDGARARANKRLQAGQSVRVPPLRDDAPAERPKPKVHREEADAIRRCVLYRDADAIVINKPPGLAVQGGSRLSRHLDGMLDALRFDGRERPRLVHRLDKDTSGVLVLARHATSASRLAAAFRGHELEKLYWALVVGVPGERRGSIDISLTKKPTPGGERVAPADDGRSALTNYAVVETAGGRAAWLALEPKTGRTHQLRAHLAAIGTPIQGDGKYGGQEAFLAGDAIAPKLHLHAREITFPDRNGDAVRVVAPLPEHMAAAWSLFGFDPDYDTNPLVREAG